MKQYKVETARCNAGNVSELYIMEPALFGHWLFRAFSLVRHFNKNYKKISEFKIPRQDIGKHFQDLLKKVPESTVFVQFRRLPPGGMLRCVRMHCQDVETNQPTPPDLPNKDYKQEALKSYGIDDAFIELAHQYFNTIETLNKKTQTAESFHSVTEMQSHRYKEWFVQAYEELENCQYDIQQASLQKEKVVINENAFATFFTKRQQELENYFETLTHIFHQLKQAEDSARQISVFFSMLSAEEKQITCCYCHSEMGTDLHSLIGDYDLFGKRKRKQW